MARQLVDDAQKAQGTASQTAGAYGSAATGVNGTLTPVLTNEALHPTGFTPQQKNAQLVAGEQGAGGATGAVAGTAGLQANRSRNSGALSSVLDSAARAKSQAFSGGAENVATKDAALQQANKQAGVSGLEKMYGTDVGAQLGSEGQVSSDINAGVAANNTGWLQNTLNTISTITGAAKNVSGAMYGGGNGGGFANQG